MQSLCDRPAHELRTMLGRREISASEIVQSIIDRIETLEGPLPKCDPSYSPPTTRPSPAPGLHAYLSLSLEQALEQARDLDAHDSPDATTSLRGIPLAVKDVFCIRHVRSTAGSRILAHYVAPYDATVVARFRQSGAILIGKTNTDEFAFGSSCETSAFWPTPRNPWRPTCVPGGSSGGSAAAVAAGEAIVAIGTDTAGSIRQPASFCGVVGLKPTYGLVSRYGVMAFASSMDCVGPLTRDVTDAALMLNVMAGIDPLDATTIASSEPSDYIGKLGQSVRGLRLGVPREYLDDTLGVDDQVRAAIDESIRVFSDAGAHVVSISLPHTQFSIPCYFVISRVEASSNLERYTGAFFGERLGHFSDLDQMIASTRGVGFGLEAKLRILMGVYLRHTDTGRSLYRLANRMRQQIRQDFADAFRQAGCLLGPTTPTTAFPRGSLSGNSVAMQYADRLTVPADHAGCPAVSLPCGFDATGLPIGLHLIGPHFDEARLLQWAFVYESATQWHKIRPPLVIDDGAKERPPLTPMNRAQPGDSAGIGPDLLERIAQKARLVLGTPEERDYLRQELNAQLGRVHEAFRTAQPHPASRRRVRLQSHVQARPFRPDLVKEADSRRDILSQAPLLTGAHFSVPTALSSPERPKSEALTSLAEPFAAILDVRAPMATRSKLFCSCSTDSGALPNTNICPVCVGLPGALPVLNAQALALGLRAARALQCEVNSHPVFVRRSSLSPLTPGGFEIGLFQKPLAQNGWVHLNRAARIRRIRIDRLYLAAESGCVIKNDGAPGGHRTSQLSASTSVVSSAQVDLNPSGLPLLGIVTATPLTSRAEVTEFLEALRRILAAHKVIDPDMSGSAMSWTVDVELFRNTVAEQPAQSRRVQSVSSSALLLSTPASTPASQTPLAVVHGAFRTNLAGRFKSSADLSDDWSETAWLLREPDLAFYTGRPPRGRPRQSR